MPDIQCYFENIIREHEAMTDNSPMRIDINKIENRIIFRIKAGYYLKLLTFETMKLLQSSKSKISKDKNLKNVFHLEITEVVLVHCNIISNYYQQYLRVIYS